MTIISILVIGSLKEMFKMPKTFSENERIQIKNDLIKNATDCIKQYGMIKTTVEELVKRTNISKGSFYSFYKTKELLFWDVLLKFHNEIEDYLQITFSECTEITVDSLTNALYKCYKKCFDTGLGNIIISNEINYLIRKLPQDIVLEHLSNDDDLMEKLIAMIPNSKNINIKIYSGAFRGIFLFLMYKSQIGENFDDVLKLTIRGIVIQMLGDDKND